MDGGIVSLAGWEYHFIRVHWCNIKVIENRVLKITTTLLILEMLKILHNFAITTSFTILKKGKCLCKLTGPERDSLIKKLVALRVSLQIIT